MRSTETYAAVNQIIKVIFCQNAATITPHRKNNMLA